LRYEWTARDGTIITLEIPDPFTFEPGGDKVTYPDIICHTYPVRESAGKEYEC